MHSLRYSKSRLKMSRHRDYISRRRSIMFYVRSRAICNSLLGPFTSSNKTLRPASPEASSDAKALVFIQIPRSRNGEKLLPRPAELGNKLQRPQLECQSSGHVPGSGKQLNTVYMVLREWPTTLP